MHECSEKYDGLEIALGETVETPSQAVVEIIGHRNHSRQTDLCSIHTDIMGFHVEKPSWTFKFFY